MLGADAQMDYGSYRWKCLECYLSHPSPGADTYYIPKVRPQPLSDAFRHSFLLFSSFNRFEFCQLGVALCCLVASI